MAKDGPKFFDQYLVVVDEPKQHFDEATVLSDLQKKEAALRTPDPTSDHVWSEPYIADQLSQLGARLRGPKDTSATVYEFVGKEATDGKRTVTEVRVFRYDNKWDSMYSPVQVTEEIYLISRGKVVEAAGGRDSIDSRSGPIYRRMELSAEDVAPKVAEVEALVKKRKKLETSGKLSDRENAPRPYLPADAIEAGWSAVMGENPHLLTERAYSKTMEIARADAYKLVKEKL